MRPPSKSGGMPSPHYTPAATMLQVSLRLTAVSFKCYNFVFRNVLLLFCSLHVVASISMETMSTTFAPDKC